MLFWYADGKLKRMQVTGAAWTWTLSVAITNQLSLPYHQNTSSTATGVSPDTCMLVLLFATVFEACQRIFMARGQENSTHLANMTGFPSCSLRPQLLSMARALWGSKWHSATSGIWSQFQESKRIKEIKKKKKKKKKKTYSGGIERMFQSMLDQSTPLHLGRPEHCSSWEHPGSLVFGYMHGLLFLFIEQHWEDWEDLLNCTVRMFQHNFNIAAADHSIRKKQEHLERAKRS